MRLLRLLILLAVLIHPINIYSTTPIRRVVLKGGGDKGRNILNQEMINEDNTIFVILDSFMLLEDIKLPNGCTLEFDGGLIYGNYTIFGKNTSISADITEIFSGNVKLSGTWMVVEVYPEWFGALCDGINDDAIAINKCLSFSSNSEEKPLRIMLTNPQYTVGETINFSGMNNVSFEGTYRNRLKKIKGDHRNMFDGGACKNITIKDLTLDGSLEDKSITISESNWSSNSFNACIKAASSTTDFLLDNCVVKDFYYGVFLGGANEFNRNVDNQKDTDHISIINCVFEGNRMSCIDTYNRYGLFINNNLFRDNGNIAVHIEPAVYDELKGPYDTNDIFTSKYTVDGVNICNNTFIWTDNPCRGIKLYNGVYAANVTNNHFINGAEAISSESTKMFTISNNTIKNGKGIIVYGNIGTGIISDNILINVTNAISCYNNAETMGSLDVHNNTIILKEDLDNSPDAFNVQNSRYHDNIIKGYFNNSTWGKRGVLDITGSSNCEIYNNKLLKCKETAIPFFVVPISNQAELSDFIKRGVKIYANSSEQLLDYEFSTDVAKTRPVNPYIGQSFYDLNLNKLLIYIGQNWVDTDGNYIE